MKPFIFRVGALVALGAVDYLLNRPWRLVVLLAIVVYLIQWTAFQHRREAIHIVRQRRHRQANQLQLVAGWLQLGAANKAEEALKTLLDAESAQTQWLRGFPSRWSYLFLRWDARAEERGMEIRWENIRAATPTYLMAWMLEWRLSQAMRMTANRVRVDFQRNGFRIVAEMDELRSAPGGWHAVSDGLECRWGGRGRDNRGMRGSSA